MHHRRRDARAAVGVRVELRRLAALAGVRRRFAPHQRRHAHAVELERESVPLNVIQRELGHANLDTTSIYRQGIDTDEIIATVHARRAAMMSVTAGLPDQREHCRRSRSTVTSATASRTSASASKRRPGPAHRARTSSRAGVSPASTETPPSTG
jgi:hypothetical protein